MNQDQIAGKLKNSELFRSMTAADIGRAAELCRVEEYPPGECVFKQGDYGEHIYIVVSGLVHLERSMNLGARKGQVLIDALGKGRTLGCWSALLGEAHILMSSAACQQPTTIVVMKGTDLRTMMIDNPELGFNVMERLSFLLRDRIQAAYGAMEKI